MKSVRGAFKQEFKNAAPGTSQSSGFPRGTRLRERLRLLGLVQRERGERGRAIHARPGMDTRRGSAHGAVRSWRQQAAGPRGGPPDAHQRERVQAGRHQLLWPEQRVHACLRAPRCRAQHFRPFGELLLLSWLNQPS